jgi:alanyl-tRNA synthetase
MDVESYWEKLRIKTLPTNGYRRYKCKVCGANFWSLIPRDTCNDVPCSDYTFFNIPTKVRLNVRQSRDIFLNFFSRRGHEVIEPKPVVARWRDDLYLTIASIVVFQPHVTSGIVPPPANPLVIAQPCIRLEDIDAVGYTLGRHLTNFIMGGHHAFNYPDKYVYFIDETIDYAREFFKDEIGVPEEEITFKESWWEGGGNAGPCLEVCVGGLEVATLVFMMFKSLDGGYSELPLKIVDTGYGIERISWLTSKTPTAFHAVYNDLINTYYKLLDTEVTPPDILWGATRLISRYDTKRSEGYSKIKSLISNELGLNIQDVSTHLDNAVRVFTLLDHVKTALLMLSDGVVPSNAGEGYLARLVLRRIFRILKLINKLDVVHELFKTQIRFWSGMYLNVSKNSEYVLDVVENELSRFNDVMMKATSTLRRYVSTYKKLDINKLVELYDSHGLPPDLVAEECRRLGVSVEVPENFYSLIASRHSRPPIKPIKTVGLPKEVIDAFKDLPPTRRLFHEDPYIRRFKARVVGVLKNYLVLDQTSFYPEGGGQKSDVGEIFIGNEVFKVIDVQKIGDVIVHVLDKELPPNILGSEVSGEIDWFRRYSLMRHHTATHIVLASARSVLGSHVWQAGAEKSEDRSRLDITHYKSLSKEDILRIEDLANEVVLKCIDVNTTYLPRYDAESRYGLTLYQGGVPLEPVIRVVEIPGVDAQACFGTHLRNTCEVGGIKIVNVQKIQDGVIRLEFVAGTQLVRYVRGVEELVNEALTLVGGSDLIKRLKSINEELNNMKTLLNTYRGLWLKHTYDEMIKTSEIVKGIPFNVKLFTINDKEVIKELLKELTSKNEIVAVALIPEGGGKVFIEISISPNISGVNAVDVFNEVSKVYSGRGGGKRDHVSGYINVDKDLDTVINTIKNIVREYLTKI